MDSEYGFQFDEAPLSTVIVACQNRAKIAGTTVSSPTRRMDIIYHEELVAEMLMF